MSISKPMNKLDSRYESLSILIPRNDRDKVIRDILISLQMLTEEADDPALVARKGIAIPIGFQTNVAVSVMVVCTLIESHLSFP